MPENQNLTSMNNQVSQLITSGYEIVKSFSNMTWDSSNASQKSQLQPAYDLARQVTSYYEQHQSEFPNVNIDQTLVESVSQSGSGGGSGSSSGGGSTSTRSTTTTK